MPESTRTGDADRAVQVLGEPSRVAPACDGIVAAADHLPWHARLYDGFRLWRFEPEHIAVAASQPQLGEAPGSGGC